MILETAQGGFITVKRCKVLCVGLWGLDIFCHSSLHLSARAFSSFDSWDLGGLMVAGFCNKRLAGHRMINSLVNSLSGFLRRTE